MIFAKKKEIKYWIRKLSTEFNFSLPENPLQNLHHQVVSRHLPAELFGTVTMETVTYHLGKT